MDNKKLNIEQKILLSLYRAKKGRTLPMVTRIKGITNDGAYQVMMRMRRQALVGRRLSAVRNKYKSYRFFISEAGIRKLQNKGLLALPGETK